MAEGPDLEPYVSPAEAVALGTARGIRILPKYEVIAGKNDVAQCTLKGLELQPYPDYGEQGPKVTCGDEDLLEVDSAKFKLLQGYVTWAAEWLRDVILIPPRTAPVQIPTDRELSLPDMAHGPFADTDLVVYFTARPTSEPGYAFCAYNPAGRCLVGVVNVAPRGIVVDDSPETATDGKKLLLHELLHLLGAVLTDTPFLDDQGKLRDTAESFVVMSDTVYNRTVTLVKSPKVVALARAHFGCDKLEGVPLEDFHAGVGAHWEARLMGPEIMSYGAGSGEPYVSDLTLAFLEDSGIYAANYSAVRPLIVPTADDLKKNKLQFLQQEGHAIEGYTPPARSPGALRWGKGEGCAFVFGSVAQWGDQARPLGEGYQRYTCDGNPETMYGCTADNKMSAVCSVETFGPDNPAMRGASGKRSCNIDPFTRQETCVASDRGAAYLPSAFDYFGDPSKGSFGAAMDFVPFRAGYWNCQEKQMKADNDMGEGRTGFGLNRLAGDTEANMKLFGGQAHCPECRCFISSLSEYTRISTDDWLPKYGLCYPSNCYREDRLQFALVKSTGTHWYRCPPEGGSVYVPGYLGAFYCPPAREFCQFEAISGFKNPETSILLEWIFIGIVVAIPVLFVGSFVLCRRSLNTFCCGQAERVYLLRKRKLTQDTSEGHMYQRGLLVLKAVNALGTLGGLAGLGVMVYALVEDREVGFFRQMQLSAPLVGDILFVSGLGLFGSAFLRAGKFWPLLIYFYLALLSGLMFTGLAVLALAVPDRFVDFISLIQVGITEINDGEKGVQIAHDFGTICAFMLFLFLLGACASAAVVSRQAILESFFNVLNIMFIVMGPFTAFFGYYGLNRFGFPDNAAGVPPDILTYLVAGLFTMLGGAGVALSRAVASRGKHQEHAVIPYVVVGTLLVCMLGLAGSPWIQWLDAKGEKERREIAFGYMYVAGAATGAVVSLVAVLLGLFHSAVVGNLLNSFSTRSMSNKRLMAMSTFKQPAHGSVSGPPGGGGGGGRRGGPGVAYASVPAPPGAADHRASLDHFYNAQNAESAMMIEMKGGNGAGRESGQWEDAPPALMRAPMPAQATALPLPPGHTLNPMNPRGYAPR